MKTYHPRKNDKGQPVALYHPSQPTDAATWRQADQIATVTPDGAMPSEVNHLAIASWSDAPPDAASWEHLAGASKFDEPPMPVVAGKAPASGAVVIEPDGRVWVVSPSNGFGGYTHTFPKGKLDPKEGLSLRANALKEVFEESGLRVELTGFLCDSVRDTSVTRYYLARRVGGSPAAIGWESQAVNLVPISLLPSFVAHKNDADIVKALNQKTDIDISQTSAVVCRTDDGLELRGKIKVAKEKIRNVFNSIECEEIKYGFNTVLVYALLELASEEGKDDGWFREAFNETMWERHDQNKMA
jgi:ADP-ribose pyrophosphatase YjhB (NUDIX family)